jgi:hypothetical protein
MRKKRVLKAPTVEELTEKLKKARAELARTRSILRVQMQESFQLRVEINSLLNPIHPRPLETQFSEDGELLLLRFSRPVAWIRIDEASAKAFGLQLTHWLRRRAEGKKLHLRLVKKEVD